MDEKWLAEFDSAKRCLPLIINNFNYLGTFIINNQ